MAGTPNRSSGYVAECFWPGVSESDIEAAEARVRESARDVSSDGQPVRYLGSLLFPEDEVVFFEFAASSPEAARLVSERAGILFERIVASGRTPEHGKRGRRSP